MTQRLLLSVLLLSSLYLHADVTLPAVLADHMVVQRGLPVHVWGMASPAENVSASFRGETRTATADELGRWSLYFSPGEAGGPFSLAVKGSNTVTLNDILVGDVWVASGQSNMEWPLKRATNAEAEMAAAKYPKIRIFQLDRKTAEYPLADVSAKTWVACAPDTAGDGSAVAYFFARDLQKKENVPIGLIDSYWGGSAAESWTSLRALSADASLMPVFASRVCAVEAQPTALLRAQKENQEYEKAVADAQAQGKPAPNRPWHQSLVGHQEASTTPWSLRSRRSPFAGSSGTRARAIPHPSGRRYMPVFFKP